jgi:Phosphotransferase enzyme family
MQVGDARFVLRKQPPGKLLASAHAVDREYAVLSALQDTAVPVPRTHCLCMDASVIGSRFYIMDFVPGRLYLNPALPGLSPAQRTAIYRTMAGELLVGMCLGSAVVHVALCQLDERQQRRHGQRGACVSICSWLNAQVPWRTCILCSLRL